MLGHAQTYAWYSAEYGSGRLGQDEYEAVLPDAEARVDERIAHRDLSAMPDGEIDAYKRAVCAACEALADPAASSYTAGGVSERLVDAASMSVDRAIDRMLAQAPGRILYGAWL